MYRLNFAFCDSKHLLENVEKVESYFKGKENATFIYRIKFEVEGSEELGYSEDSDGWQG